MKKLLGKDSVKVAILTLLLLFCVWLASLFTTLTALIVVSLLLSYLLNPLVNILENSGINRTAAVAIVFVTIGGILGVAFWFLIPIALDQLDSLSETLKTFPLDEQLTNVTKKIQTTMPFLQAGGLSKKIEESLANSLDKLVDTLSSLISLIMTLVIVPFVMYFLLAQGKIMRKRFIEFIPNKYLEMTLNVLYKIRDELSGYIIAWLLDAVIVGVLAIIGLTLLGINKALVIGVAVSLANLVPYVGPVIGVILAVFSSVLQFHDFNQTWTVVGLFIGIRLTDDLVIQPLVYSKKAHMHPLGVVIFILTGYRIMGILGMVLAIPMATIIIVTAKETYWGLRYYRICKT